MTKYAKTASGSNTMMIINTMVIVVDTLSGCWCQSTTTAENGRIKAMISREEAIEKLKDMRDEAQGWNDTLFTVSGKLANSFEVDVQTFNMAIEALSQPERPKGRWVHVRNTGFYCSICQLYSRDYKETRYCPNCGADMRGEEE